MHTPIRRHLIASLLMALTTISTYPAFAEQPESITIQGTYTWKVGSPANSKPKQPDFWWQHKSRTESFWNPRGGASAAIVKKSFEAVTASDAMAVKLSNKPIAGQLLAEGTVLVFKTSEGKLGKMTVVGFDPLLGSDGTRNYNIKLRWQWL